ncbi:hypothetical protein V9T40_009603 [Parthenolecanium corni]|uniref:Replication protein A subunit n=1 Tax=Parthenolecanium corni TaxID=536013 RepID=A0AAN9Y8Y6_9HEMI
MSRKLTEGCIAAITSGQTIEKPVVQLLNHKKISSNNAQERYRVIISDGIHYNTFAMLATQLNEKIVSGELPDFTIMSLDQYISSELPNGRTNAVRKVLVILSLTIIVNGREVGEKIGDPKLFEEGDNSAPIPREPSVPQPVSNRNATMNGYAQPAANPAPRFGGQANNDAPTNIIPIVAINPYQNRWTIKARVVSKSAIRTWSNPRGEGKLFSMDILDESASIRATAFTDVCDKFHDMMELNKVYYISRAQVKPANKKFTSIPHDFELTLGRDTEVITCVSDDSIPQIQYNFTPLNALKDIAADSTIDVIGICQQTSDIQNLVARTTRRDLKKRDITLVDSSDASIVISLWDSAAEQFDGSSMPVVAIKGGRLTEYQGGKSISIGNNSTMQINPDIPKAHQLRGWYDSLSDQHQFSNISNKSGGDGNNKVITLKEASLQQLGTHDKTDYFSCEGTVMYVPSDRVIYLACPTPECNKKVVDNNNGSYRCEKCNQIFNNFKYRLILRPQIGDWTGTQWVNMFQDVAEQFLGATADDIGNSKDVYQGRYDEFFRKPLFKTFVFRIAARMDTYNNETRLKMTALQAKPIDFKEASKKLIRDIEKLGGVSVKRT